MVRVCVIAEVRSHPDGLVDALVEAIERAGFALLDIGWPDGMQVPVAPPSGPPANGRQANRAIHSLRRMPSASMA